MASQQVPIVQGVAITDVKQQTASPYYPQQHQATYDASGATHNGNNFDAVSEPPNESTFMNEHGQQQQQPTPQKKCQDAFWALLFIAHLVFMVFVITFGIQQSDYTNSSDYSNILYLVGVTGLVGIGLSFCTLSFMLNNTLPLVKAALIFSVVFSLVIAIFGLMSGSYLMGGLGLLSFAIQCCYAKIVWPRLPYAASNLRTALTAVHANLGLSVISFVATILALVWTALWFLGVGSALSSGSSAIIFGLFLSYYWVHQVLQNTMQVTTAGVVGTWWFVPGEANRFCSTAITDSFARATTYSFGSICLGSFLVALVQALRALERHTRDSDDLQFVSCIIQCILGCIESIIEEINKWAYVYVGLYGFSYLEAGRNVITLFKSKGWTTIITDNLAENVLFMMSMAIGLATGLVGLALGAMNPDMLADLIEDESGAGLCFFIGLVSGFLFASIVLSVVGSAVNTVIVCYAEDPAAFHANHPALAQDMRAAWMQAWPEMM